MATEERNRERGDGRERAAHDGPGGGTAHEPEPLPDLAHGTVQRAQLPARVADIAWTALVIVLGVWVLASAVGIARGTENAWVFCAVGAVLFAVALRARLSTLKARARTRL
ncbi:hypothetical protein [Streptomyces sp. NPDC006645]|uniref:hypothetical protein n=1 Tax=unclassified Streptomyces TaxID=2593676 RepID=UPI0033A4AD51